MAVVGAVDPKPQTQTPKSKPLIPLAAQTWHDARTSGLLVASLPHLGSPFIVRCRRVVLCVVLWGKLSSDPKSFDARAPLLAVLLNQKSAAP